MLALASIILLDLTIIGEIIEEEKDYKETAGIDTY